MTGLPVSAGSVPVGPVPPKQTFVLCFDGTGNKFHGDETDSNILKIYRMLDRADGMTYTFYQPGIGTYVATSRVSMSKSVYAKIKSWYVKSKDAAIGTSFADHVMGGYRFLMRYYSAEDDLYFFGFSRGAYTARFLAEMLDHVGLLSAGNEEMADFAWKTYAKWCSRHTGKGDKARQKERDLYNYMRGFRETFSRKVRRIRFLGLFDTVNSVPALEGAWMQRSKFPYTAKSSAKVIRHAVSIDERRAKFRQDLISGSKNPERGGREPQQGIHRFNTDLAALMKVQRADTHQTALRQNLSTEAVDLINRSSALSVNMTEPEELTINADEPEALAKNGPVPKKSVDHFADAPEHPLNLHIGPPKADASAPPGSTVIDPDQAIAQMSGRPRRLRRWSDTTKTQDIEEVWFPGCHGDIGGGWPRGKDEHRMLSHVPLTWMVREAEAAGLKFDPIKMAALNCCPDAIDDSGERHAITEALDYYHAEFHSAATEGKIHDALIYGDGLGFGGVSGWKIMEYLPFRRMDLQADGSWKPIRWPLPGGETRDIPTEAQIHVSAINRMKHDPKYRPGNLIIGGGGRGVRHAPGKYGTGEWTSFKNDGDHILQTYVRTNDPHEKKAETNGKAKK